MRRQVFVAGALLTLSLTALVAACSSETIIVQCSAGQSAGCVDGNGCAGTKTCGANGAFGVCQCAGGADASLDTGSQPSQTPRTLRLRSQALETRAR